MKISIHGVHASLNKFGKSIYFGEIVKIVKILQFGIENIKTATI